MRQLKITQSITSRDSHSIDKYLHEIARFELISADEEAILAQKIRKGDDEAMQRLVNANLRFVVSVAKQYQNNYLTLNDLINEGNLGLVKAAQRFDETRGFKFISYAVWWIRQSIMQAMAEQSRMIRLPINKVGALTKLNRVFADLEQKFEREPTQQELSDVMELDGAQIADIVKAAPKHVSMDAPFQEDESNTLMDVLQDANSAQSDNGMAYTASLSIDTERILTRLSETQRSVIKMYFGLDNHESMHLNDIADELGLSKERIRQIKDRAITRLRSFSKGSLLKNYLCQ